MSGRSDPGIALSNGDARDLHAAVDDAYTDVRLVSGAPHSAIGTSVTSEVHASVLGPQDTVHYYALLRRRATERPWR